MRYFLLLSSLVLGSFYANAQLSCQTPIVITNSGTFTVPKITGTNNFSCYPSDQYDSVGNPMASNWYSITPTQDAYIKIQTDETTHTSLQIVTGTCGALVCYDTEDTLSTYDFVGYKDTTYYIVWDSYYSAAGFNFEIKIINCLAPKNVDNPSNVTQTSATLNWDVASSNPMQYEIEYGPIGFKPGEGIRKTVDTNSANLSGLNPSTNYYYYIRSACSDDNKSLWIGPYMLALAKEVPYASGFDSIDERAGWKTAGEYGITFGLANSNTGGHNSSLGYYNFQTSKTKAVNNWLFTPAISLTKGQVINTSFYADSDSSRKLNITIGKAQNIASQTEIIYSNTDLNGKHIFYTKFTSPNYTVPETGIYYFGINDFSDASTYINYMNFDTFSIDNGTLSVNEFASNQFSVFPNPTNGNIMITNNDTILVNSISISDMNGRIVKKVDFNSVSDIKLNISDLASGMYLLKVISDKGIVSKKIVKN